MFPLVLGISALLILNAESIPPSYLNKDSVLIFSQRLHQIYLLGKSFLLTNWEKKYFSSLYISHLLTPSGLHLTSLFVFVKYILNKAKLSPRKKTFIKILLLAPLCFIEGFYSLRRVAIFSTLLILNQEHNSIQKPGSLYQKTFFATFFIDFINGSYFTSPFSFIYSFLFWGAIISVGNFSKKEIVSRLLISQLFLAGIQEISFYPIGFLLGQLLTLVYSLCFPLLLIIEALLFSAFQFSLFNPIHDFFYLLGKFNFKTFSHHFTIFSLLYLVYQNRFTFTLSIFLFSFDCKNQKIFIDNKTPIYRLDQKFFLSSPRIHHAKTPKEDFILKDHLLCRGKLRNTYWDFKCKKKGHKK